MPAQVDRMPSGLRLPEVHAEDGDALMRVGSAPSPRVWTYTTAQLNEVNALKTSVATAVGASVISAFDGTEGGQPRNPRTVTVTTTANPGSYKTGAGNPIVVTGLRGGAVVTENLLLTNAGGGETIRGTQLFDTVTSIAVPGQNDAGGHFQFGYGDVGCQKGSSFAAIKGNAAGTIRLGFSSTKTDSDSVPVAQNTLEPIAFERVIADQATSGYGTGGGTATSVGFTVYAPSN